MSAQSVPALPAQRGGAIARQQAKGNDTVGDAASPRWSALVEWLLVGGATLFLFPLSWLVRHTFALDDAEYAAGFLTFYGAYVINDPHFAVTYLLFYKNAKTSAFCKELPFAQRARWWVSGAVVPVILTGWAVFAFATRSAQTFGWMVQLMYLLVGWHYVKQGFGVLTVLSARRGVTFTARERVLVLAHCFAAWAFAWANPAVAAGEFEEKGVIYGAIAHPRWLELLTGGAFAVTAVTLAIVMIARARARRTGPGVLWGPLSGFLATVWLWTVWSSINPLVRYLVPALHSLQYGYFVWLMKRNEARAEQGEPKFGAPPLVRVGLLAVTALTLAWVLFHGGPLLFDGALTTRIGHRTRGPLDDFGATPFFAAIYVIVNIHHYFMDRVIWRRENPEVRYLRT